MAVYELPDLHYDYGALEPHLSGRSVELHHDRHHRAYVDGANRTAERLFDARRRGDFEDIGAIEHALAFHVSGHLLHSIFWRNLTPQGGGRPDGELATALDRDFGGFDSFKKQLVRAAATVMGSGWGALVWEPVAGRLETVQIHDHQSQVTQAGIPLLVVDAWEHAYYLQYENDKARYLEALWNLWSWDDVANRYALARRVELDVARAAEAYAPPPALH